MEHGSVPTRRFQSRAEERLNSTELYQCQSASHSLAIDCLSLEKALLNNEHLLGLCSLGVVKRLRRQWAGGFYSVRGFRDLSWLGGATPTTEAFYG